MAEPSFAATPEAASCPWCSAALPQPDAETCPACGATLIGGDESEVPGVTAVDGEVLARATRRPRSSAGVLGSLLGGEEPEVRAIKDAACC